MLAVLDASPVGGGPVSRALSCAASQTSDTDVVRLRAFDLFGRVCSTCNACTHCGRCTRHHPALDEAISQLARADSLLVGTTGHLHVHDPRARALVERLVGAFGHVEVSRGIDRAPVAAAAHKRAAIVCAAPPLLGVPAMLGMLPAGASGVWRVLERGGATVVGCASVGTRWAGPRSWDHASEPARELGRKLAGARRTGERRTGTVRAGRVAAALTTIRPA